MGTDQCQTCGPIESTIPPGVSPEYTNALNKLTMEDNEESNDLQVVSAEPNALEQIISAEVDLAIATSKKYPRDLVQCKKNTLYLAAADQETAEACFFSLPREKKNKETGKMEKIEIEGESIRLAEIMLSSWKNIKFGKRIVSIDKVAKKITAEAVVYDMENNVYASESETRNICTSKGYLYSEEMITMTGRAAKSIALRNAVFQVIPKVFFKQILNEIKAVAAGTKKGTMVDDKDWKPLPLDERARKAVKFFVNWNISEARVFHAIGVKSIEEITEEKLQTLTGIRSGVNQGEISLLDAFPMTSSDQSKEVGKEILAKAGKTPEAVSTTAAEIPAEPLVTVIVQEPTVPAAGPTTEQVTASTRPSLVNKHKNKGA
jgi:hypothetical protein